MRDEDSVKRRLAEIEFEILKCDDMQKIWRLKKNINIQVGSPAPRFGII